MALGLGLCGCACVPCGPIWIKTGVCDPNNPSVPIATAGIVVVLKDGGGATVGTCTSSGQLGSVTISNSGIGYTTAPTLTVAAPGGAGVTAKATCTVSAGHILSVTVTDPGSGYTATPTITVTPTSGGSGAVLAAHLVQGCRFTVPTTGTYTYTASKTGYRDATGTVASSSCSSLVTATVTLTKGCGSLPTTLHGTSATYGTFTLTSGTGSLNVTGTVVTNCGGNGTGCATFAQGAGTWTISFSLVTGTCLFELTISWDECCPGTVSPDPRGGGNPGFSPPMASGTGCKPPNPLPSKLIVEASTIVCSPLSITFVIPSNTYTYCGVAVPFGAGDTITLTP